MKSKIGYKFRKRNVMPASSFLDGIYSMIDQKHGVTPSRYIKFRRNMALRLPVWLGGQKPYVGYEVQK